MNNEDQRSYLRSLAEDYVDRCCEYHAPDERERLIADWERKEVAARGIVADFIARAGPVRDKRLLDVGFGNGVMLAAFAREGARMSGLEVNEVLYDIATQYVTRAGLEADLKLYDGEHLPYVDHSFDGCYAISVLEHVSNPQAVLNEISRVLTPGGVLYLAFPNRLNPHETHTKLWLLSYLPRRVASWVVRRYGRNTIEELNLHFIGYVRVARMLQRAGLTIVFETQKGRGIRKALRTVLAWVGIHHTALLPHIMIIARKPQ